MDGDGSSELPLIQKENQSTNSEDKLKSISKIQWKVGNLVTQLIPIEKIDLAGQSINDLLDWWKKEKKPESVRFRFGNDEEALKYFPNHYYEKLEKDWTTESVRINVPLDLILMGEKYHVEDGWHRLALCYLHNIKLVPAIVEIP